MYVVNSSTAAALLTSFAVQTVGLTTREGASCVCCVCARTASTRDSARIVEEGSHGLESFSLLRQWPAAMSERARKKSRNINNNNNRGEISPSLTRVVCARVGAAHRRKAKRPGENNRETRRDERRVRESYGKISRQEKKGKSIIRYRLHRVGWTAIIDRASFLSLSRSLLDFLSSPFVMYRPIHVKK